MAVKKAKLAAPQTESAPADSQQPAPADDRYEPGHEPGDAGSGLGPVVDALPEEARATIAEAIEDAATQPDKTAGIQPHGIANLTQPMPAATEHELKEHPDEVATKQTEAFGQTAAGQAVNAEKDEE